MGNKPFLVAVGDWYAPGGPHGLFFNFWPKTWGDDPQIV